jgi:hypothetical protein
MMRGVVTLLSLECAVLRIEPRTAKPILTREEKALAILDALESMQPEEVGREAYIRAEAITKYASEADAGRAWLLHIQVNDEVICRVRLVK